MADREKTRLGVAAMASPLEIPYLREWVDWHREIGFGDFYLALNDWSEDEFGRFQEMFQEGLSEGWMRGLRFDGAGRQTDGCNFLLKTALEESAVDWLAFIDVDEFVRPRGRRTAREVLGDFAETALSVALNWRLYGSSGLEGVVDGDFSVMGRFRRCGRSLNRHVKQILNLALLRERGMGTDQLVFRNPHCLDLRRGGHLAARTPDGREQRGYFDDTDLDRPRELELAHYATKSREECRIRRSFKDVSTGVPRKEGWEAFFAEHDVNEVDDGEVVYAN